MTDEGQNIMRLGDELIEAPVGHLADEDAPMPTHEDLLRYLRQLKEGDAA